MAKPGFCGGFDIDDDEYGDESNYGFGWGGADPTTDDTDEYGE